MYGSDLKSLSRFTPRISLNNQIFNMYMYKHRYCIRARKRIIRGRKSAIVADERTDINGPQMFLRLTRTHVVNHALLDTLRLTTMH